MSVSETTTALTDTGIDIASMGGTVLAARDYHPGGWFGPASWSIRAEGLRDKYGRAGAMPKKWGEVPRGIKGSLAPEVLDQCRELARLGHKSKAIRLAYCGRLASVWVCPGCGRPGKKRSYCRERMCKACAKKNFDKLFIRFMQVDGLIPAAVRTLPGWGWFILDLSFRHDGDFPTQQELRNMVQVIRRTVGRAVREKCQELYRARAGCRLRLNDDGSPVMSVDGWPVVGAQDGEARELVGWEVVYVPEHLSPDNEARKQGRRGAKKKVPGRLMLRFGYELVRVTEFGFDNVNAHFHCAYFGPPLDYWKNDDHRHLVCGGRLVEIFKEESRKPLKQGGLGVESYAVLFEPAKRGYRSVLAHALKYTQKLPASTPKGLAQLEHVLEGTRRVALLGAHYGVPIESSKCNPRCRTCRGEMVRLEGLGLVPLSEVEDLPDVGEDSAGEEVREPEADEFLEEEVRGP